MGVSLGVAFSAPPVKSITKTDSVQMIKSDSQSGGDPYGVSTVPAKTDSISSPTAKTDSTSTPKILDSATVKISDSSAVKPTDTVLVKKPRSKLVRETTVNTLDNAKGQYRSPKRALFMSLVIPGLGQAYVGQSSFNYARAAVYLGTDVALGYFWYQFVVVKHDRKVKEYRSFADKNWSQGKYEDSINVIGGSFSKDKFNRLNPFRETYCKDVQNTSGKEGNSFYLGCLDPKLTSYAIFKSLHDDKGWTEDSIRSFRNNSFPSVFDFYENIGKEQEFITGWKDAKGISYNVVGDSNAIGGTSAYRDEYVRLRSTANGYARMQAFFLGGILVNHIVSALDAALTAHSHNKSLYQTPVGWLDRVHLEGGIAFAGPLPYTRAFATLTF